MTASPPRPHRTVSVLSVVPGNLPQTQHECSPGVELLGVTCLGVFVLGDHTPQGICPGDHTPQGVRDNVLRATCGPGFQFLGRALSLTWLVILMALRPVSSPPGGLEDFCGQKYYCQSHPVYEELIQNWALPNVALSICHCTFDLQFREFHPRVCLMDRRGSECRVARRGCGVVRADVGRGQGRDGGAAGSQHHQERPDPLQTLSVLGKPCPRARPPPREAGPDGQMLQRRSRVFLPLVEV